MEAPDRKRLKPTHKPAPALPPLPPGWTEHSAPTGHKYYYNKETKTSTYARPVAPPPPAPVQLAFAPPPAYSPPDQYHPIPAATQYNPYPTNTQYNPYPQDFQSQHFGGPTDQPRRRPQPHDRPKRKEPITNCQPWLLVYTKLGRRFVHNPDTNESFWKFPPDVMKAVVEFDRLRIDEKANKTQGTGANKTPVTETAPRKSSEKPVEEPKPQEAVVEQTNPQEEAAGSESEYEEIEVTDDEDEEGHQRDHPQQQDEEDDQPVEFNEDDIAYQLAAMEQSYGLDPGEYGGGLDNDDDTYQSGDEGLPLTAEDSTALFLDMLEDLHINPYTPWDTLITNPSILNDSRYTILPTSKSRKEAWSNWSREKIHAHRLQREQTETQDPRIPYLFLLSQHATPKLYWQEFKRKFKKEPAMKDIKLSDKEREKLYREHISRLKLPSSTLKSDLAALLKSVSLRDLNRETTLDTLPKDPLTDIRFISLPQKQRDELVEAHISTLASAPDEQENASAEETAERDRKVEERRRREVALREREEKVQEEKRRRERDIRVGIGRLREGERELEEAMRIGRQGLRGQLDE